VYNLTAIFNNSVTPRMISASGTLICKARWWFPSEKLTASPGWGWGAKTGLFYAGTNALCLIWCWFRLPETKDRTFGEIDILFENRVPARKFKYTKADRKSCCCQFAFLTSLLMALLEFALESDYVQEKVGPAVDQIDWFSRRIISRVAEKHCIS
jgi:SP family general alpha glucoside:H+ symporter-like MFS transporter